MEYLIPKITGMVIKKPITGDDAVDRMHYFMTVAIMVVFAVISGIQEYVSNPLNCWTPTEFNAESDSYYDHINSYCWTQKLRFPRFQHGSPETNKSQGVTDLDENEVRSEFNTALFKWATVVFIVQAFLFKFPNFLWHRLNTSSGTDLQKIRDLVLEAQDAKKDDDKSNKMDEVVTYFENWITGYRSYQIRLAGKHSNKLLTVLFCLGKKSGNYLSSLYLFIKILNVINVIVNFCFLTLVLDFSFWKYGFTVLRGDWQDSNTFPKLLLCDFVLEGGKESGSEHPSYAKYELQCLMTLNLLLEKVFAVEWFWLAFLLIVTVANLLSWAVRIKPPCSTILFTKSYMKILKTFSSTENGSDTKSSVSNSPNDFNNIMKEFVEEYLRSDGVFVLRLLELNANKAVVADVVRHLWNHYHKINNCSLPGYSENNNNGSVKSNNYSDSEKKHVQLDEAVIVMDSAM